MYIMYMWTQNYNMWYFSHWHRGTNQLRERLCHQKLRYSMYLPKACHIRIYVNKCMFGDTMLFYTVYSGYIFKCVHLPGRYLKQLSVLQQLWNFYNKVWHEIKPFCISFLFTVGISFWPSDDWLKFRQYVSMAAV